MDTPSTLLALIKDLERMLFKKEELPFCKKHLIVHVMLAKLGAGRQKTVIMF